MQFQRTTVAQVAMHRKSWSLISMGSIASAIFHKSWKLQTSVKTQCVRLSKMHIEGGNGKKFSLLAIFATVSILVYNFDVSTCIILGRRYFFFIFS